MRNKLIKLVSRSTRCRLFWDHFKTCWDVCGAFEDINLDKLNHKHNNEALSLFQFWDIPTMFGTFRDKFWDMRLLYFWDILGHFGTSAKQKSSESGPETTPEGHRSKQTDQPNPVRSCDVWPFQNILGHILGHVGTFRDIRWACVRTTEVRSSRVVLVRYCSEKRLWIWKTTDVAL